MTFNLSLLIVITLAYLVLLFFVAMMVDRGKVPVRWLKHPATYTLSIGVYASSWAFYGSVSLANEFGYGFLAYYIGISGAFLLAPVTLKPILRITRHFQLTSLADLFAFRYRSRLAGSLVAGAMLLATLPLVSLQITTVSEAATILTGIDDSHRSWLGLGFAVFMAMFALLFGARHVSPREKHASLVFAMAFESFIKLITLLILSAVIYFSVFDGFDNLNQWLIEHPEARAPIEKSLESGPWRTLLLLFFAASVVMPHMFHMTFTENLNPKAINKASWGVPLYMLLICIAVPLILWAGIKLNAPTDPEYFAIGIGMALDSPALSLIVFIGGIAAASGIIIVTALATASMCLNHLFLPFYKRKPEEDLYGFLLKARRIIITALIGFGYLVYILAENNLGINRLGIIAYVATLQFLPGVIGVLYWPNANRLGFIWGICVGMFSWLWMVAFPNPEWLAQFEFTSLISIGVDQPWYRAATYSVIANLLTFILISMVTRMREEEIETAEACSIDTLSTPQRFELTVTRAEEFIQQLAIPLGQEMATKEVRQALVDLDLNENESRPYALRRLRSKLEANLSGLMGPSIAYRLLADYVPFRRHASGHKAANDLQFIEAGLETYQNRLTGLAAELDNLRRYHRQLLEKLPLAACSISTNGEILMWNQAMADITHVEHKQVMGANISDLPEPWQQLIFDFSRDAHSHVHKRHLEIEGRPHWFNLHKAIIRQPSSAENDGQLILLEDLTDTQRLEDELVHSERLASIGRLAAGVAHEIGNPVTGIACLAQNLKYETEAEAISEVGTQILDQTKRVTRIVESLVNFSHAGQSNQTHPTDPVDLNECVQEAVHLISLNKVKQIKVRNQIDGPLRVIGDGQRLLQVFVNLLSNSFDACEEGGEIQIQGHKTEQHVILEVIDNGSGIDRTVMEQIFEPFFTTKDVGKGTGLGLAMVYSIVEEHFGQITFDSPAFPDNETSKVGTKVTLTLPNPH